MATERIIGIDFGTSTSVIRVKRYENGQPVDDRLHTDKVVFDSRTTVPTLIKQSAKGRYYGYDAEKLSRGDEQFKGFKVNLESEIPQLREQARELTREFFCYLYNVYASQSEGGHLGEADDRERTIISYPVKWSQETREFMLQAARDAKFKNVEGMDEAQAAIYAVTVQNENQLMQKGYFATDRASNILLIDMGAGTTDLVLCKKTPGGSTEIVCTWPVAGEVLFGGQEMEKILRSYIGCYLDKDDPMSERLLNNLGELAFKTWKEKTVSKSLLHHETVEEFSELDTMADMAGLEVSPFSLGRPELETIARNYLDQFPQLVNGCLNEASKKGVRREDIDLVILTGGHSQWYFVKDMLLNKQLIDLPKIREDRGRILDTALPQETVALGMVFSPMAQKAAQASSYSTAVGKATDHIQAPDGTYSYVFKKADRTAVNNQPAGNKKSGFDYDYYSKNFYKMVGWRYYDDSKDFSFFHLHPNGCLVSHYNDVLAFDIASVSQSAVVGKDGNIDDDFSVKLRYTDKDQLSKLQNKANLQYALADSDGAVALYKDGTVWSSRYDLSGWRDMISVFMYYGRVIGLRRDGTALLSGFKDKLTDYIASLRNITMIHGGVACGGSVAALRKDGTVLGYGDGSQEASNWRDIICVAGARGCILGVTRGGRVLCTVNNYGMDFSDWRDVIAVTTETLITTSLTGGIRIAVVGLTRQGKILLKEYDVKESFFNKVKSSKLCTNEVLEHGIFDNATVDDLLSREMSWDW